MKKSLTAFTLFFLLFVSATQAQSWEPVTGADDLARLFSDTVQTATLKEGVTATATYNSDGTGELKAWGDTFPRNWKVEGDDRVCIGMSDGLRCFTIEVDSSNPSTYRGTLVSTGETVIFTVEQQRVTVTESEVSASGAAAEPSAEEIAAKLANPNAPMASLTFRLQYRTFDGDLPGASSQDGTTLAFQPSFPFTLANGDVFFFPAPSPVSVTSCSILRTAVRQRPGCYMQAVSSYHCRRLPTMRSVLTATRLAPNS
jgi:hypothetical protein